MRRWIGAGITAAVLGMAGEAAALLAPHYYEDARRTAPEVIVIAVAAVAPPPAPFGDCAVSGAVRRVERGGLYGLGQSVTIAVPCSRPGAHPPIGGTIWRTPDTLATPFGRAYLDAAGTLILSQYEPLAALPGDRD
ncbi:hypothetical protein [Aquabacter spiritensis]|uniref:Uncharacterized protein n=1 Tax=Aquabacter spiritensis TaxID=933073 RepID=A0A4R3LYN4_9HYPH|nr:hypothetical protein [Aquabacter spiritensis]TCT03875.1 hypothetical protein EDC64_10841 [Aquabacter spiritensis]